MPLDMPPTTLGQPPSISVQAPACRILTNIEAQAAFAQLRQRLPSTTFAGARASEVCGMVRVELARGTVAYTDATGRYFMLALALDTHRGSPADVSDAIDTAIDVRSINPGPTQSPPGLQEPTAPTAATQSLRRN